MSYLGEIENLVEYYSEPQIRFILGKFLEHNWSDDMQDDFYEIIESDEFKEIR